MPCSNFSSPNQTQLLDEMNNEFALRVLPVTIFVGIEIFIGFFGNLFTLYVFIFRYRACNYRIFVICLTSIDFLSTLTTMPAEMLTQTHWYKYPYPKLCKAKDFFNVFTVFAEALCLLAIAIDRYRKVCRPLAWQIKRSWAVLACVVTVIIASGAAYPVTVFWGTICKEKTFRNTTLTVQICEKDQKYQDSRSPPIFQIIVGSCVFLCLIVMFVLYLLVTKALRKEEKKGFITNDPHYTKRLAHRKKAKIMIAVTGCFMVTIILYYVMIVILGLKGVVDGMTPQQKVAYLFFLRFYFVQHIINPILYAVMDPKFKETFNSLTRPINNLISSESMNTGHESISVQ